MTLAKLFFVGLALAVPAAAAAQEIAGGRYSDAHFYDCVVSSGGQQSDFAVSYLVFSDASEPPQVNFKDPSKILAMEEGWAPENIFAISSLSDDDTVFVWLEESLENSVRMKAAIEISPDGTMGDRDRQISLTKFVPLKNGRAAARRFEGTCTRTLGVPAYQKFLGDDAQ